jgi:hypothetical protein
MLRKQILAFVLTMFAILYVGQSSAATLSFSPASTTVGRGDTFDVDVVISDLGTDLVGAFDFTVGFDPSIISSTDVQFGSSLGDPDPFAFETITGFSSDNVGGTVDAFNISLLLDFELTPLQAPSFTLATLSFQALSIGSTSLDFLFALVSDDLGLEIGSQGVSGEVSVVPIPAALWLFGTGLIGLIGLSRRKKLLQ